MTTPLTHFRRALGVLSLSLLAASCADQIETPPVTTPSLNRGLIAYTKLDYANPFDGPVNVQLMDSNGTTLKVLIENASVTGSAAGRFIAGVANSMGDLQKIVVANNDGSGQRMVSFDTSKEMYAPPAISADGKHIAFTLNDRDGATNNHYLYISDLTGANARLVTSSYAYESLMAFSADGHRLAFYNTDDQSNTTLRIVDVETGAMTTVAQIAATAPDYALSISWSKDGSMLAFVDNHEVSIVNSDGTNRQTVGAGLAPYWSPTSNTLAFTGDDGEIYTTTNGGATKVNVSQSPAQGERAWGWSIDGNRILCESWSGDYDHSTTSITMIDLVKNTRTAVATPGVWPIVLK